MLCKHDDANVRLARQPLHICAGYERTRYQLGSCPSHPQGRLLCVRPNQDTSCAATRVNNHRCYSHWDTNVRIFHIDAFRPLRSDVTTRPTHMPPLHGNLTAEFLLLINRPIIHSATELVPTRINSGFRFLELTNDEGMAWGDCYRR